MMIANTRDELTAALMDALDLRDRRVQRIDLQFPANDVVLAVVTMFVDREKLTAALVKVAEQERIASATKAAA